MKSGGNVGRVSGQIKTDARPAGEELKVTQDFGTCGKGVRDESLLVGGDGGLANAVVYILGLPKGGKTQNAAIDQSTCVFKPHVLFVASGSKIALKNSDPVLHNAHATNGGGRTEFNLAMPVQNQTIAKPVKIPAEKDYETIKIGCDAGHTWMSAHIFIGQHSFGAVTDDQGNFSIPDVPAGNYQALVWHEKQGSKTVEITIPAGGETKVDLKL